jgi:exodeoxyribonuclease V beta subunit
MTFPLHGTRLIEASAGTGKTFTIAGLYLRLLLGHGLSQSCHSHPLRVDQILVVTFTEAATAELRGRIRARIHEARLAFARGVSEDTLLQALLTEVTDHTTAARRLLQAEREMDTAAVYTIHGFCQRMLLQNAFESGSRFQYELITDESHLKAQVVADYWRRQFYPLSFELASEVSRLWPTPWVLLDRIGTYLSGTALEFSLQGSVMTDVVGGSLEGLHQENLARIDAIKTVWRQHQGDVFTVISTSDVNKRSYTKKSLPQWIEQVSAWAERETVDYECPDKLERFSQQYLQEKTPKGTAPVHPLFSAVDEFLSRPVSLEAPLVTHAIRTCRMMLAQAKKTQQWLSFDDLLSHLSLALKGDRDGQLAERIRALYPVAMIDEFQDTDPLQYHIFSHIYAEQPDCGLLMIGDPKQAIYAFRGADIFTYIKARRQVASHFTLATNWRSARHMIASVNRLFMTANAPFIYQDDIPFLPVDASAPGEKRYWQLNRQIQPAMTYWWPNDSQTLLAKKEYEQIMAEATAARIQTILQSTASGQGWLVCDTEKKPIEPGHIAVLVRTGREGKLIKDTLARQGIASVYLSNRDSVFASPMALEIQRLLQAVLSPENERTLRATLASSLFNLAIHDLDALNDDEILWDSIVHEFQDYRRVWAEQGVLPMLRSVLYQRQLARQWLADTTGERTLTDYLHLGELLQQAAAEIDSEYGLLRWLTQSVADAAEGSGVNDEQIQRLESEKNLVQIITIHKSKGLEYDLVFLPFAMSYREAREAKYYDEKNDRVVLEMAASEPAMTLAEKERLAEDLRLLYVALTRSVYGCFVGVAALRKGRSGQSTSCAHLSAMGYLLQQGEVGDVTTLSQGLQSVVDPNEQSCIVSPPALPGTPFVVAEETREALPVKQFSGIIERRWRVTSYSNLVKQSGHPYLDASFEIPGFDIDSVDEMQTTSDETEDARTIFTFPKGPAPGTFLHSLFEQIEFTEPIGGEENTRVVQTLMDKAAVDPAWLPVLQTMVEKVMNIPLDNRQLQLNQITAEKRLVEMEFLLPIALLQAPALNRILQKHDDLSAQAGDLGFSQVEGMLKGFIDLVFEYQGRYYVLDWKSNYLGNQPEDYHPTRLKAAMIEHRYDLQYHLYTLALHRFLQTRLADYSYRRHIGGVFYVFLRGVDGRAGHGIFSHCPDAAGIMALDRLITGQTDINTAVGGVGQMELDL